MLSLILDELSKIIKDKNVSFRGYDVAPQAIDLAQKIGNNRISFHLEDILSEANTDFFDVFLIIDVLEHISD